METIKKALKVHTCNNCAGGILKGENYKHDVFYVKRGYDNEFDSYSGGYMKIWRTHVLCRFALIKLQTKNKINL